MATMEADVNLVMTYQVPEGVSLESVGNALSNNQWAVAVDGRVVTSGSDTKVQPTASTTKMILALAVMEKKPFEKGSDGETIMITKEMYDKYAWYIANNGSNTKVEVGEEISERDALISVMLASSNNMADSLAIWAFGSIEEYQEYATEMLNRLGVSNTTIGTVDASGYDESTTSTPEDLAVIGYYVMKNPVLAEIVGLKSATVPVAGEISNTNKLLGQLGIVGVKTGYIGEPSGYCIISGYLEGEHIMTVSLLGSATRERSFNGNLAVVEDLQEVLKSVLLISKGEEVGYYRGWWLEKVPITAAEDFSEINYKGASSSAEILVNALEMKVEGKSYKIELSVPDFSRKPSLLQRFLHVFGWEVR
ncbi:D-alanyl-D-alanine carboxypeptidase [Candidatus Saccharibacteria bacterium]|nr:D-alanyl-D-alanine carboxypeptidase [Candidatus Saccharibacteria bacterium]